RVRLRTGGDLYMPTMDIIGYLWTKRQELDLYSVADALQLVADLTRQGLDCIQLMEMSIMGVPLDHSSVVWRRLQPEEWEGLVADLIAESATEHALEMLYHPEE